MNTDFYLEKTKVELSFADVEYLIDALETAKAALTPKIEKLHKKMAHSLANECQGRQDNFERIAEQLRDVFNSHN